MLNFHARCFVLAVAAGMVAVAETASAQATDYSAIAEQAIKAAAERQARESAEWEKSARETAEKTAKEATEDAIKAAVAKAAKEAAAAAAKAAAEEAAKTMTDEKAAKEEEKAAKEERKEERRQIETRVFKLNHASATEVAENLNQMWSGDFGVNWKITKMAVAFPEPNSVMVTAPRLILDACTKAIQELDVEAQQVYIEARFVELGNSASHKVGIDWSMLDGMQGRVNLGGGIQQYNVGSGVTGYTKQSDATENPKEKFEIAGGNGSDGSLSYFQGTLSFSEMYLTLRALDATEDAKTFSNPKIIVSSGKKATVDMTTKYPNVNIAAKKTINNNNESVDLDMKMAAIPGEDKFMFAKESFFSWGITLEVVPRISTNGLINVSVVPTISELDTTQGESGFVTAGTSDSSSESSSSSYSSKYPIIEVKRLVTEFDMASGSTAVIGGLSVTKEKQIDNGIPVLRSIPWIGPRLFGSLQRIKEQKEIIVFVTVGLVDPRAIRSDAGLPKNAILGRQYTKGQKLEPGDRPEKNMEGFSSLDMRPLEEQEQDPLAKVKDSIWNPFSGMKFFSKDPSYKRKGEDPAKTGSIQSE